MKKWICVRCYCAEAQTCSFVGTTKGYLNPPYQYLNCIHTDGLRCTAEYAWWVVLGSPEGQSPLQGLRPALEESGTLELMDFNIIHRIVTGLIDLDLEQMVNLYPELVDKPDSFGQTPLFWAVARDDIPATLLLIRKGAKVRSRNHVGAIPRIEKCST